jgi:hypothetical protein
MPGLDRELLKTVLDQLTRQYEAADESRRRALRDMLKAQTAIKAIYALATDEPLQFNGTLADACRTVMLEAGGPKTPMEIRDSIVALGYNLTQHKNPLASIHSVLKRLMKSGYLKPVTATITSKDGSTIDRAAYEWVGDVSIKPRGSAQRGALPQSFPLSTVADLPDVAAIMRAINSFDISEMTNAANAAVEAMKANQADIQRAMDDALLAYRGFKTK